MRRRYELVGLEAPKYRRADVAELTGVAPERTVAWWRALGFAEVSDDELAFIDADVDMVRQIDALVTGGGADDADILRLARILGTAFSRLADAQLTVIGAMFAAEDDRFSDEAGPEVFALLEHHFTYVWRRHLVAAIGRRMGGEDEGEHMAIGFLDLTGFTKLTRRSTAEELSSVIDRFEESCFDVVSIYGGRVIKMIGDEVMFGAESLADAVDIGLELIERIDAIDELPPPRCGLSAGETVTVGGDVFGTTVNRASRLTDLARPGTILVPRDDAEVLAEREDLQVTRIRRPFDLKGIGRTPAVTVSRR